VIFSHFFSEEFVMNKFEQLITFWLPKNYAKRGSDSQRGLRLYVIILWFNIFIGVLNVVSNPVLTNIIFSAIFSTLHLISLAIVKGTGRLRLAYWVDNVPAIIAAILAIMVGGGLNSTPVWLLYALPIIGMLVLGRSMGAVQMGIAFVVIVAFGVAQGSGVVFPVVQPPTPFSLVTGITIALLCLCGCAFLFEQNRVEAEKLLEAEKASVQHKVDEAVTTLEKQQAEQRERDAANFRETSEARQILSSSINKLLIEMQSLAGGDLTVQVSTNDEGEIGLLYAGFNETVEQIRSLVAQVAANVNLTAAATAQIADRTNAVSEDMKSQLFETNGIAAAMDEMSATIEENSMQVTQAVQEAERTEKEAERGGVIVQEAIAAVQSISQVVERSVEVIRELDRSSEAIGDITKVIDEIADQTNLLALNAAIEAARAGEQGRGFAVVADEVRKLAERTQQATKEISITVKSIQNQTGTAVRAMTSGAADMEKGNAAAARAKEALDEIIGRTRHVVEVIGQVATASEQQAATVTEIARSIEKINHITQHSVDAMQGNMLEVGKLERLAQNLESLLHEFKIDKNADSSFHSSLQNSLPSAAKRRLQA
jgi:methyl-accepting chemotaxis protein